MKITDFSKKVSIHELGKKQVDITQILQILKVMNKITKGILYVVIKAL